MSPEESRAEQASRAEPADEVEETAEGPASETGTEDGGTENSGTENESAAAKNDSKLPRRLVLAAAAFALAALLASGIFGVMWWVASADDNADRANTREDVVRVGSSAIRDFTELDYNNPDQYFDRAVAASTKEIGDQINAGREQNKKTMVQAKTVTTTKVMDIAVEELNTDEGKASFLAAIQVEVKQGDKSSTKPMRVEVQMTRQGQDWKLSGIDPVPVVSS